MRLDLHFLFQWKIPLHHPVQRVSPGTGTEDSCFARLIEGHFELEPEPKNSLSQRQGLSSL